MCYQNGLYHKKVFLPRPIQKQVKQELLDRKDLPIKQSKHLQEQSHQSWRREYDLADLTYEKIIKSKVIEVEMIEDKVSKIVVRKAINDKYDICIVISLLNASGNRAFTIKACWLNGKTDTHKTLDKSKYVTN